MISITSNGKQHLFDNFWMFKTQNTEYNYIYVENYLYKNLTDAVEICKNQTKTNAFKQKFIKYIL